MAIDHIILEIKQLIHSSDDCWNEDDKHVGWNDDGDGDYNNDNLCTSATSDSPAPPSPDGGVDVPIDGVEATVVDIYDSDDESAAFFADHEYYLSHWPSDQ